jgi:hypothetical protein
LNFLIEGHAWFSFRSFQQHLGLTSGTQFPWEQFSYFRHRISPTRGNWRPD